MEELPRSYCARIPATEKREREGKMEGEKDS